MSNFQKISLGAEKLNEIFVKKNDNDISIKIKRAMTEEEFYVGSDKLNAVSLVFFLQTFITAASLTHTFIS